MGQARQRRLQVVSSRTTGEAVEIPLGDKTADRLAALFYAREAAVATVQAAAQVAQTFERDYHAAVTGVCEVHGVEVGETTRIEHDPRKRTLTVGGQEKPPQTPTDPPPTG